MTLSKYINELLYRYECVIIPEFGGLLTRTESAKIDEESYTFHPPTKRLGFNSQLVENDGLLANHIASVDKIPYETALNFIKFEVLEWKSKLENGDLSLEDIGIFSLNEEGKLLFEPDTNSNFLTDAFGLSTITTHAVSREEQEEEFELEEISDVINDEEIAVNNEVLKKGISPFFKYAAAIVILLGIIGLFAKQIFNLNKQEKQIAKLTQDQEAKITKRIQEATFEISSKLPDVTIKVENEDALISDNDSISQESEEDITLTESEEASKSRVLLKKDRVEKALAKKEKEVTDNTNTSIIENNTAKDLITTENTTIETPSTSTTETIAANTNNSSSYYKYHIIAGAFREPTNAEKKVRQLKAKGYEANIVGVNKWHLTQVAFGSYATKEEAQTALRNIKNTVAKDAWLLVK